MIRSITKSVIATTLIFSVLSSSVYASEIINIGERKETENETNNIKTVSTEDRVQSLDTQIDQTPSELETPVDTISPESNVEEYVISEGLPEESPNKEVVNEELAEQIVNNQIIIDKTDRTVKDGIHVDVYYPSTSDNMYIPEFTVELWSLENELISTVVGNSENYDSNKGVFHLFFNHQGFKLGDKFALIPRKMDSSINYLEIDDYQLKANTYHIIEIEPFDYYDDEETVYKDLTGTDLNPFALKLNTSSNKIGLILTDESSNKLKNFPIEVKLLEGKGTKEIISDNNGIAWLDSKDLSWKFLVSSKDKVVKNGVNGKAEIKLPTSVITGEQDSILTFPIIFKEEQTDSAISINLNIDGNTELSTSWAEVNIKLSNGQNVSTHTITPDVDTLYGIEDGTYKVEVLDGKYATAKVKSSTLKVSRGKAALDITISPKHTLAIDKDGKEYNFSIINVDGISTKEYKGKDLKNFAVTPGESYMIKDNESGNVYNVNIDPQAPLTKLVLGVGVVFWGDATAPHTGDSIIYYIIAFAVFLAAGVGLLIYDKNKRVKNTTSTFLLIGVILTLNFSLFSPIEANASSNIGGAPPASGGGTSTTPAGAFQVSDKVSVLQVGFIINKEKGKNCFETLEPTEERQDCYILSDASNKKDFEDQFKFDFEKTMFYMAPNKNYDQLLKDNGSALISFERGGANSKVRTLYGKNPLYKNSSVGEPHSKLENKILPYADLGRGNKNRFVSIMAEALYNIEPNNSNRTIAGPGVVGNSIGDLIEEYVLDILGYNETEYDKVAQEVFNDYLTLVRVRGVLTDEEYSSYEQMMQEAYRNQEVVLFVQTMVGVSVKDNNNPNSRDYAFMSTHNLTDWYLWVMQTAKPKNTTLQKLSANREAEAASKGGSTYESDILKSPYKENGNIPFSARTYLRDNYTRTLKPISDSVKLTTDLSKNPFGGWGYNPWGYQSIDPLLKPAIDVKLDVTVLDFEGRVKDNFQSPVKGWEETNYKYLNDLTGEDAVISGGLTIKHQSKIYDILPEENVKFTLMDKKDNENINKFEMTKNAVGEDGYISIPKNAETWEIYLGFDTPLPQDLHAYLGGDSSSLLENKYEGQLENGKPAFSHAQLTLYVKVMEDTGVPYVKHEIPQWRLSKYFEDISPNEKSTAVFELDPPISTFRSPKISPSGVTFNLIDPKLDKTPWAISRAKLYNDSPYRKITPYNYFATFNLAGDLLAVKDNISVSNVKLASWKNNYDLYNKRINPTTQGAVETASVVRKSHTFEYNVKSPYSRFEYSELRTRCGKDDCWSYRWEGEAKQSYIPSLYKVGVTFERYLPKESVAIKQFPKQDDKKTNGFYWESYQDKATLNVNPEVLMAFDDQNGNTSVAFAAGDRMRQIQPVHYNQARFVNVNIVPTVTGQSVATDSNAKQLASRLGSNGKQVIYKGSSVTNNFDVKGQLEFRTFALDIGNSALKNTWGNSSYSTNTIYEEYMSRYATKQADGTWLVNLGTDGKLKINNKDYGGQKDTYQLKQASKEIVEHTLVVRGGKLLSVDGVTDFSKLDENLRLAIERMKISTPIGDNIFNTFEREQGNPLGENKVADLGNAVRGTNDMKKGTNWYNEDTSVLVIREYITKFDLPQHNYVDKVPMSIPGLEAPIDMNMLFSKGYLGHTKLKFQVVDAWMEYDSSQKTKSFGGEYSIDYVIGNVSITDSFDQ